MKRAILAITVAIAAIPSAYPAPASAARLTVQPSQFAHVIVVLKTQVDPSTVTGSEPSSAQPQLWRTDCAARPMPGNGACSLCCASGRHKGWSRRSIHCGSSMGSA